jgi:hypothetical protein
MIRNPFIFTSTGIIRRYLLSVNLVGLRKKSMDPLRLTRPLTLNFVLTSHKLTYCIFTLILSLARQVRSVLFSGEGEPCQLTNPANELRLDFLTVVGLYHNLMPKIQQLPSPPAKLVPG